MPSRTLHRLGAALCFVAGCTGIIHGESDAVSNDDRVSNGTAGSPTTQAPEPAPPGSPGGGGGESNGWSGGGAAADSPGGRGGESGARAEAGGASGDASGGAPTSGAAGGVAAGGTDGLGGAERGGAAGSEAGQGGAAGDDGEPALSPGDPSRGFKLVVLNDCYRCHGGDLSGRGHFPNITPDEATGVGTWSDEQLALAIRGGIHPDGDVLCASMPIYSGLKPQGLVDMVAFLRSIPPKFNALSDRCDSP